jgi:hypothetical protein
VLTNTVEYLRSEDDIETAYSLVNNFNEFLEAMDAEIDNTYDDLMEEID